MEIDFSKETKGISITKNGVKASYSAGVAFRGFPTGDTIANIDIYPFNNQPISQFKVNTATDTITVNGVEFDGEADDATDLIDQLRDDVFIADA